MTGPVIEAIELVRLSEVPLAAVRALLNEPRNSRDPGAATSRLGFRAAGEVDYDGVTFRQYRLTRADWRRAR